VTATAAVDFADARRPRDELADALLAKLTGHVRSWDRHGRNLPGDAFSYYPRGTAAPPPGDHTVSAFRRPHGTLTITWPPALNAAQEPVTDAG
jgi:hypothetical protein